LQLLLELAIANVFRAAVAKKLKTTCHFVSSVVGIGPFSFVMCVAVQFEILITQLVLVLTSWTFMLFAYAQLDSRLIPKFKTQSNQV